ncbi:MAG: NADH:ubiquinone reductase (Na(+)-transporting) subunit D [Candidatus Omnitrophica bacterium]|nr:NADH:ubiquinone reductase (Na(+)-transporting) subunit D [Candidatus Omnitrophota bacterium]
MAFTKKERKIVTDPLWDNNPITLQILGICSALAVTVQMNTALVMSLGVIFVVSLSNVLISMIRNYIPDSIRIIVYMAVIASLVIVVDQFLQAYLFELSLALSVFVGLIITNCIVMGRAEAFASKNPVWPSFLDGIGNTLGYSVVLLIVASVREILGKGTWFGIHLIPDRLYDLGYMNNGLMVLSPGAFLIVGLLVWSQRSISGYAEEA